MNNFQLACKQRTLFPTLSGSILVTDLYSLEVEVTKKEGGVVIFDDTKNSLRLIGRTLKRTLKSITEDDEDFTSTKSPAVKEIEFKLEIVKAVIDDKKADQEAKLASKAILAEKQRIKGIAAEALLNKEVAKVQGMSEEELKAILAS